MLRAERALAPRRLANRASQYRVAAGSLPYLAVALLNLFSPNTNAQEALSPEAANRPAIKSNRWQEDWSPLADEALKTEPFDSLKYISLSDTDPQRYASLGLTLRERFESNDASGFG